MKLLQKVALVGAAATLILSGMALIRGEFHDAAVGVFLAACVLITNFRLWPTKPLWRAGKARKLATGRTAIREAPPAIRPLARQGRQEGQDTACSARPSGQRSAGDRCLTEG